jgi:hypothetical protein
VRSQIDQAIAGPRASDGWPPRDRGERYQPAVPADARSEAGVRRDLADAGRDFDRECDPRVSVWRSPSVRLRVVDPRRLRAEFEKPAMPPGARRQKPKPPCPFDPKHPHSKADGRPFCDGSGFLVDEDRTARDCACRLEAFERARERSFGGHLSSVLRSQAASLDRLAAVRNEIHPAAWSHVERYIENLDQRVAEGTGMWLVHPKPKSRVAAGYKGAAAPTRDAGWMAAARVALNASDRAALGDEPLPKVALAEPSTEEVLQHFPDHATHLVAAVCEVAREHGYATSIYRYAAMIGALVRGYNVSGPSYEEVLNQLLEVDVLAIHSLDLGGWRDRTEEQLGWVREQLYLVATERDRADLPTLLTTTAWPLAGLVDALGDRTFDRLASAAAEPLLATMLADG